MSHKSRDNHGRWRSITIGFRASKEESDAINEAVALSGLPKTTYIINKLLDRDVIVQSNSRTFKALKDKMDKILIELKRLESTKDCTDEFLETIKYVTYIYTCHKEDK